MRVLSRLDGDYDMGSTFGCFKIDDLKYEIISWWTYVIETYGNYWSYDDTLVLTLMSNRHSLMTKNFSMQDATIEKLNYFIDTSVTAFKTVEQYYKDNNESN